MPVLRIDHVDIPMPADELAASKAHEKQANRLAMKHALRHLRKIVSPFYDPSKRTPAARSHRNSGGRRHNRSTRAGIAVESHAGADRGHRLTPDGVRAVHRRAGCAAGPDR